MRVGAAEPGGVQGQLGLVSITAIRTAIRTAMSWKELPVIQTRKPRPGPARDQAVAGSFPVHPVTSVDLSTTP